MALPISMEDEELFPKHKCLVINDKESIKFLLYPFQQMYEKLSRIWWSRLVISVRGYVANYVENNDEILFHCDDAFIMVHQNIVESTADCAQQFLLDLETVVNIPEIITILDKLNKGDLHQNPFSDKSTSQQFTRIFGQANSVTYRIANAQILAYLIFMHTLTKLQQRWLVSIRKRKSIRFEEDPEWQPDDRVVLFQNFFQGNRTWVLTDFDRHILRMWRPNGSSVIFGDRFIEEKKKLGYALCSYCGILEQYIGQFAEYANKRYCSQKCLDESCDQTNLKK